MASGRVDTSRIKRAVQEYALQRAETLADRFVEVARGYAPRRTSRGADSIEVASVAPSSSGVRIQITVGEQYMRFQNEGTGVYGPAGRPITPKNGNVLVFDSLIGGGLVFARSVRGTEPTHFWDRAVDQWPRIVADA